MQPLDPLNYVIRIEFTLGGEPEVPNGDGWMLHAMLAGTAQYDLPQYEAGHHEGGVWLVWARKRLSGEPVRRQQ